MTNDRVVVPSNLTLPPKDVLLDYRVQRAAFMVRTQKEWNIQCWRKELLEFVKSHKAINWLRLPPGDTPEPDTKELARWIYGGVAAIFDMDFDKEYELCVSLLKAVNKETT